MSGRIKQRPRGALSGQHYLGSSSLAAEIAEAAQLTRSDFVVEFGAGYGRLTEQLASRAGNVLAVEIDVRLADRLAHRFRGRANVAVVKGDALAMALPARPFRVVSNPPFHLTSPLLHRLLDDPCVPMTRAELVVGWGAAVALTGVFGPAHKATPWSSRYEFLLIKRLPAAWFSPAPATDAALVSIRRKDTFRYPRRSKPA